MIEFLEYTGSREDTSPVGIFLAWTTDTTPPTEESTQYSGWWMYRGKGELVFVPATFVVWPTTMSVFNHAWYPRKPPPVETVDGRLHMRGVSFGDQLILEAMAARAASLLASPLEWLKGTIDKPTRSVVEWPTP